MELSRYPRLEKNWCYPRTGEHGAYAGISFLLHRCPAEQWLLHISFFRIMKQFGRSKTATGGMDEPCFVFLFITCSLYQPEGIPSLCMALGAYVAQRILSSLPVIRNVENGLGPSYLRHFSLQLQPRISHSASISDLSVSRSWNHRLTPFAAERIRLRPVSTELAANLSA